MPAKTNQAIARQWELLKLLPSRPPGKSSRELAEVLEQEGFKVTKRTVERDLNELMILFPLVCNDKGTPYGWHWLENAHCDLPSLPLAEALSLRLLEDFLKPLLPESILRSLTSRFQLAKTKLKALADLPTSKWADKVRVVLPSLSLLPPQVNPGVQEIIHEALLAEQQVKIIYQSPIADSPSMLTLHPLGLVQRGPVTYLVATAFEYDDVRIYPLHRVLEAKQANKACHRPFGFSLDDYLDSGALQFGDGKPIKLKATISKSLAKILEETPLSKDMTLTPQNDTFLLGCTVIDSWQLHWWILSQAGEIEVLAPKLLRKEISTRTQAAGAVYGLF